MVLVDGGDFVGSLEELVPRAVLVNDVPDEELLAVVGRKNSDLFGRNALETQVHVGRHDELRFCQVLIKERLRRGFSINYNDNE